MNTYAPHKPTLEDLQYALRLTLDSRSALQLAQVVLTGENLEGAIRKLSAHVEGLRYQIEVLEIQAKAKVTPAIPPETI